MEVHAKGERIQLKNLMFRTLKLLTFSTFFHSLPLSTLTLILSLSSYLFLSLFIFLLPLPFVPPSNALCS
jgi:hypothetical protein